MENVHEQLAYQLYIFQGMGRSVTFVMLSCDHNIEYLKKTKHVTWAILVQISNRFYHREFYQTDQYTKSKSDNIDKNSL